MTEPIRSACGNFYAGMQKTELNTSAPDAKNIIIDFLALLGTAVLQLGKEFLDPLIAGLGPGDPSRTRSLTGRSAG